MTENRLTEIVNRIFGTSIHLNKRQAVAQYAPVVEQINQLRAQLAADYSDDEAFFAKTATVVAGWRAQFKDDPQGRLFQTLRPEIAAYACEMIRRKIQPPAGKAAIQLHDEQLIGALAMNDGMNIDMKTGEGKTFVGAVNALLTAVQGEKVFVATVNPYLVERDAKEMQPVYEGFGLKVGAIHAISPTATQQEIEADRRSQYSADIIYGTVKEFGFDYLRDRMNMGIQPALQPDRGILLLDEVDQILIDDARTPLVISTPMASQNAEQMQRYAYQLANHVVERMKQQTETPIEEMVDIDRTWRTATTKEAGYDFCYEELMRNKDFLKALYGEDADDESLVGQFVMSFVNNALQAHFIFSNRRDYGVVEMVDDSADVRVPSGPVHKEIVLIDKQTGRYIPGNRYNNGLHQALEAKERVNIQPENATADQITIQRFCSGFKRVVGMSGTAKHMRDEMARIYGAGTCEIPEHKPRIADDRPYQLFQNADQRLAKVESAIAMAAVIGRPMLLGCDSDEAAEAMGVRISTSLDLFHDLCDRIAPDRLSQLLLLLSAGGDFTKVLMAFSQNNNDFDAALRSLDLDPNDLVTSLTDTYFLEGNPEWARLLQLYQTLAGDARASGLTDEESIQNYIVEKLKERLARHAAKEPHLLTNANAHLENEIIKNAGQPGRITVSTPMAGRGTHIELPPEVRDAGGLMVVILGAMFPRKETQLRGRCGRQGEVGTSMVLLSVDDPFLHEYVFNSAFGRMYLGGLDVNQSGEFDLRQQRKLIGVINKVLKKLEERETDGRMQSLKSGNIIEDHNMAFVSVLENFVEKKYEAGVQNLEDYVAAMIDEEVGNLLNLHFPVRGRALTVDDIAPVLENVRTLSAGYCTIKVQDILPKDGDAIQVEDLKTFISDRLVDELDALQGHDAELDRYSSDLWQASFVRIMHRARSDHMENLAALALSVNNGRVQGEDYWTSYKLKAKQAYDQGMHAVRGLVVESVFQAQKFKKEVLLARQQQLTTVAGLTPAEFHV